MVTDYPKFFSTACIVSLSLPLCFFFLSFTLPRIPRLFMVLVKFAQNIIMQSLGILLKVRTLGLINVKFSLCSTDQMYPQCALRWNLILSISNAFESTFLFYNAYDPPSSSIFQWPVLLIFSRAPVTVALPPLNASAIIRIVNPSRRAQSVAHTEMAS